MFPKAQVKTTGPEWSECAKQVRNFLINFSIQKCVLQQWRQRVRHIAASALCSCLSVVAVQRWRRRRFSNAKTRV